MASPLPAARVFPSGLHATVVISDERSINESINLPVMGSHTLTERSLLAEASRSPSGCHATLITAVVCPCRVCFLAPVAASQIWIMESPPADAIDFPSILQATDDVDSSACKQMFHICLPNSTSWTRTVPSFQALARWRSSGLHAIPKQKACRPSRGHEVDGRSPVAKGDIIDRQPSARLHDAVNGPVEPDPIGDVHRDVLCPGMIEECIGERQVKRVSLKEGRPVRESAALREHAGGF